MGRCCTNRQSLNLLGCPRPPRAFEPVVHMTGLIQGQCGGQPDRGFAIKSQAGWRLHKGKPKCRLDLLNRSAMDQFSTL
jgi:hypothetical protein